MTERVEILDQMVPLHQRRTIVVRAFIWASVLTPFLFAISGVILIGYGLLVTFVAAVLGFPAYLAFGIPGAYWALTRWSSGGRGEDYLALLYIGVLGNLGSFVGAFLYTLIFEGSSADPVESGIWYAGLGLIFGPIQALIFCAVYRGLAEPDRADTTHQQQGEAPCV